MKRAIYLVVVFMCCGVGFADAMDDVDGTVAMPVTQCGEWEILIDSPTQGTLFCTRHRPFQDEQQQLSVALYKQNISLYCDQISKIIDELVEKTDSLRSVKNLFDAGCYVSQEKAVNVLQALYPTIFGNMMVNSEIEIIDTLRLNNRFFGNLIDKLVNEKISSLNQVNGNTIDTVMLSMHYLPNVLSAYVLNQSLFLFCVPFWESRTTTDEQFSNLEKYYLSIVCERALYNSGYDRNQLIKIRDSKLINNLLPNDEESLRKEMIKKYNNIKNS